MNHIFKVIFSKTQQAFVVVSELAKGNVKTKSNPNKNLMDTLTALLPFNNLQNPLQYLHPILKQNNKILKVSLLALFVSQCNSALAEATTPAPEASAQVQPTAQPQPLRLFEHYLEVNSSGEKAKPIGQESIAIGGYAVAGVEKTEGDASYGKLDPILFKNKIFVKAAAAEIFVEIPSGWQKYSDLSLEEKEKVAEGKVSAYYKKQVKDNSGLLKPVSGSYTTAIGYESLAMSNGGLAMGYRTNSLGRDASAFGNNAIAKGDLSLAVGNFSSALGVSSATFGNNAVATGIDSMAVGNDSYAGFTSEDYVSVNGTFADCGDFRDIFGNHAFIKGKNGMESVTAEKWAKLTEEEKGSLKIYVDSSEAKDKTGAFTLAVGNGSKATHTGASAYGYNAEAVGARSAAFGYNTSSIGVDSMAVGAGSITGGNSSMAVGLNAITGYLADGAMVVGNESTARGKQSIVLGNLAYAGKRAENMVKINKSFLENEEFLRENQGELYFKKNPSEKDAIAYKEYEKLAADKKNEYGFMAMKVVHDDKISGDYSLAVGYGTTATNNQASAYGYMADAIGARSAAFGNNTVAIADDSMAIGAGSVTTGLNSMAVGRESLSTKNAVNAMVVGNRSKVTSNSAIAIGNEAFAGKRTANGKVEETEGHIGSDCVVSYAKLNENLNVYEKKLYILKDGEYKEITKDSEEFSNKDIQKYGRVETLIPASGNFATAIGNMATATNEGALAMGYNTKANGIHGTVVGYDSMATGDSSVALGENAKAMGKASIVIGYESTSTPEGVNALAFGTGAFTMGAQATSIGTNAESFGTSATAIGDSARAISKNNISIGTGAISGDYIYGKVDAEGNPTATGIDNTKEGAVAIGWLARAAAANSFALGTTAKAEATAASSVVIGNGAHATALNALAFGTGAKGYGEQSTAIGPNAVALNTSATAIGDTAKAKAAHSVSIGSRANAKDTAENGDYNNGAQSVAIGYLSKSGGGSSLALGSQADAKGDYSVAMGASSNASAGQSVAIGLNSAASGGSALAFGWLAKATKDNAIAMGYSSEASGVNATAIGNIAKAKKQNTIALGWSAEANADNAVALGAGSVAGESKRVVEATVEGLTYDGFKAHSAEKYGAISVGKNGDERQIKHVSAGAITANSSDAINGSQLYQAQLKFGKMVTSVVKDILGGDAAIAADGTITMGTIGGSANTIHKAISNVKQTADTANATANQNKVDIGSKANLNAANVTGENREHWIANLNQGANIETPVGSLVKDSDVKTYIEGKNYITIDAVTTEVVDGKLTKGDLNGSNEIEVKGAGKLVGANLNLSLKDGSIAARKLTEGLQKEIAKIKTNEAAIGDNTTKIGTVEGIANKAHGIATQNKADISTNSGLIDANAGKITANKKAQDSWNKGQQETNTAFGKDIASNKKTIADNKALQDIRDTAQDKHVETVKTELNNTIVANKSTQDKWNAAQQETNTNLGNDIKGNKDAIDAIGTVKVAGNAGLAIDPANTDIKKGDITINLDAKTLADNLVGTTAAKTSLQTGLGDGTIASGNTGLINGGTLFTEVHVATDGTYVKGNKTVGANLGALDTQVNTNTEAIKNKIEKSDIHKITGTGITVSNDGNVANNEINLSITDGAITGGKLASNAVTSDKIDNGTIKLEDLDGGLKTSIGQIETNKTDIGDNETAIGTNAGNIATNKADIADNKKAQDAWNQAQTDWNKGQELTNAGFGKDIASNKKAIADNKALQEIRDTAQDKHVETVKTELNNTIVANKTAQDKWNAEQLVTNANLGKDIKINTDAISANKTAQDAWNQGQDMTNVALGKDIASNKKAITDNKALQEIRDAAQDKHVETVKTELNNTIVANKTAQDNWNAEQLVTNANLGKDIKINTDAISANKTAQDAWNQGQDMTNVALGKDIVSNKKAIADNKALQEIRDTAQDKHVETVKTELNNTIVANKTAQDKWNAEQLVTNANLGNDIKGNKDAIDAIGTVKVSGNAGLAIDPANTDIKKGDITISLDAKTLADNLVGTAEAKTSLQTGLGDGKIATGNTGLISGGTLFTEVHVATDGTYVKGNQTVGANLGALDTQVKTNADEIAKKVSTANVKKIYGDTMINVDNNDILAKDIHLSLIDGSITGAKLQDGAVTTEKIANGTIKLEDLDSGLNTSIKQIATNKTDIAANTKLINNNKAEQETWNQGQDMTNVALGKDIVSNKKAIADNKALQEIRDTAQDKHVETVKTELNNTIVANKTAQDKWNAEQLVTNANLGNDIKGNKTAGFNLSGDNNEKVHKDLGGEIKLVGDSNIHTAGVNKDGQVKFTLDTNLTGINSISNGAENVGAKITLGSENKNVTLNGGQLKGITAGTDKSDAVTVGQLDELKGTVTSQKISYKANNGTAKEVELSKGFNFLETKDETSVSIDTEGKVTIGLADKFKKSVSDNADAIAKNKEDQDKWNQGQDMTNVALGKDIASNKKAIADNKALQDIRDTAQDKHVETVKTELNNTIVANKTAQDKWNAEQLVTNANLGKDIKINTDAISANKSAQDAWNQGQDMTNVALGKDIASNKKAITDNKALQEIRDTAQDKHVETVKTELNNTIVANKASQDQWNAEQLVTNANLAKDIKANKTAGFNLSGDNNETVHKDLGDEIKLVGGDNITTTGVDAEGTITFALDKNISLDTVTTGDTVLSTDGIKISNAGDGSKTLEISKSKVDMAGNVIKNVGAAVDGTDAVNKNQLDAMNQTITGNYAKKDASNILGADKKAWENKLGDGTVAVNSNALIKGSTLFAETRVDADGNYIKQANSAKNNLVALDDAVKENKDAQDKWNKGQNMTNVVLGKDIASNKKAISDNKALQDIRDTAQDKHVETVKTELNNTIVANKTAQDTWNAEQLITNTNLANDIKGNKTAGFNLSGTKGDRVHKDLGGEIKLVGDANIQTTGVNSKGEIQFALASNLSGMHSISNGKDGAKITLGNTDKNVSLNGGQLKGIAAGTDAKDAVNKAQLDAIQTTINGNISDATNIDVDKWQAKLGNGEIKHENKGLMTGGDIYDEVHVVNGSYIQEGNTVAENLTSLDGGVKGNKDAIDKIGTVKAKAGSGLSITGVSATRAAGDPQLKQGDLIVDLDTKQVVANILQETNLVANIQNGVSISYQANTDGTKKAVSLGDGFNFTTDSYLKATIGENGLVRYGVSDNLLNMIGSGSGSGTGDVTIVKDLTYKANGNEFSVALDQGLDFKDSTYTTAKVEKDGQVTIAINEDKAEAKIEDMIDDHIVVNTGSTHIDTSDNNIQLETTTTADGGTKLEFSMNKNLTEVESISNGNSKVNMKDENLQMENGNSSINMDNEAVELTSNNTTARLDENGLTLSTLNPEDEETQPKPQPVQIHGVADGVELNDAVNVNQLVQLQNNTNLEFNRLYKRIENVDKTARAGAAAALAAGAIVAVEHRRLSIGAGTGFYGGQKAIAVGGNIRSDNRRYNVRFAATYDSQHNVGGQFGVSYGF